MTALIAGGSLLIFVHDLKKKNLFMHFIAVFGQKHQFVVEKILNLQMLKTTKVKYRSWLKFLQAIITVKLN